MHSYYRLSTWKIVLFDDQMVQVLLFHFLRKQSPIRATWATSDRAPQEQRSKVYRRKTLQDENVRAGVNNRRARRSTYFSHRHISVITPK